MGKIFGEKGPKDSQVAAMLSRMAQTAADSEYKAGRTASGADLDQKAAKYDEAAVDAWKQGR